MTRIQPVDRSTAEPATVALLDSVQKQMGTVPNLIATMAQSPAVAKAYLSFSQALGTGSLAPRMREQIALVTAQSNHCGYCLAAHTALGKGVGLTEAETRDARRGISQDAKEHAGIEFAAKVIRERGLVSDEDVAQVRQAGYTEGQICEIVAGVALNIFTNYFNHVAATEVDFPVAPELFAA